ncbi:lipase 1 [Actinidia rufa]|uniref:Lipase 1 n=1 Tax=Actinidia rufa TaxID=165716 RepID=A0A7J0ESX7_9ERIC|nr:lipase 1 [Actinidia rufa]
MERLVGVAAVAAVAFFLTLSSSAAESDNNFTGDSNIRRRPPVKGLCADVIERYNHPCSEHKVQTKDGYVLGLHRVSSRSGILRKKKWSSRSSPSRTLYGELYHHCSQYELFTIFLRGCKPLILSSKCFAITLKKHEVYKFGNFMEFCYVRGWVKGNRLVGDNLVITNTYLIKAGDAWFLDSMDQSLGYILADHGFDVWAGSVRGTFWSHGHTCLSEKDKDFWNWSWEELALYDLTAMLHYVHVVSHSKVFVVGHSQGTIMSLAAFTEPDIVKMVQGAALLCPITYLEHVSAPLVLRLVSMHLDQLVLALGIHQLNFRSDIGVQLLDSICDGHVDCNDLLASITVIRKGTFAKYDYGKWKNLKRYGTFEPPKFDLSRIPKSLPLWMGYGGNDALADPIDFQHTLEELKSKPELLFLENYGHVDFLSSVTANRDVYDSMIRFFRSSGRKSSS